MKNRQDYEDVEQQRYEFDVAISNDPSVTRAITLIVVTTNIFDHAPVISYDGPCVAEELKSNLDTECRFKVEHRDGIENNPFRLVISGRNVEDQLFYFSEPYNELEYSREYNLM